MHVDMFLRSLILNSILIIVSILDIKSKIIPNFIVIFTMISGIIFTFIINNSIYNSVVAMFLGGGILFFLALVPRTIGGGDIKFMFALGSFLSVRQVMYTIMIAFAFAAFISIVLLVFKIKKAKDYIAFAPFLSLGCFITFHFI